MSQIPSHAKPNEDCRCKLTHRLENDVTHLQVILDAMPDAVIVTNASHCLLLANTQAHQTLELEAIAIGATIDRVIGDLELIKAIKEVSESSDGRVHHCEQYLTCQGANEIYQITLACLMPKQFRQAQEEQDGCRPEGVVTVIRNISCEKQLGELKLNLVSGVSHERRTPLSSVKAYMDLLIEGEANEPKIRSEFYTILQDKVDRLARLIDNLLNIRWIEAGMADAQLAAVLLTDLVRSCSSMCEPMLRTSKSSCTIPFPKYASTLGPSGR